MELMSCSRLSLLPPTINFPPKQAECRSRRAVINTSITIYHWSNSPATHERRSTDFGFQMRLWGSRPLSDLVSPLIIRQILLSAPPKTHLISNAPSKREEGSFAPEFKLVPYPSYSTHLIFNIDGQLRATIWRELYAPKSHSYSHVAFFG